MYFIQIYTIITGHSEIGKVFHNDMNKLASKQVIEYNV